MFTIEEIDMLGITEITAKHKKRKPGFWVRLFYVNQKPTISKMFHITDAVNRGTAFVSAVRFRDEELEKLKIAGDFPVDRTRTTTSICNVSGVVGIHRKSQSSKKGGLYCASDTCVCVATWSCKKTGKTKSAQFSEKKWGNVGAFLMAYSCRQSRENIFVGLDGEARQEYLKELFTPQERCRILKLRTYV